MRLLMAFMASLIWLAGNCAATAQSDDSTNPSSESAPSEEVPAAAEQPKEEEKSLPSVSEEKKDEGQAKPQKSNKKRRGPKEKK